MLKHILLLVLVITSFSLLNTSCKNNVDRTQLTLTSYVNPFIGTSNKGNTFPGANVPNGMTYIAPHNSRERDWTGSRYFYDNNYFYGFANTNLSGVGCGDFANLNLMPTTGYLSNDYYKNRSHYSDEIAKPGYYSVSLNDYGITAEVTATQRTTLSQYTLDKDEKQLNIIVDVTEGLSDSRGALVKKVSETRIVGYNKAGGFCNCGNQYTLYFVIETNHPFGSFGTWNNRELKPHSTSETGNSIGAFMQFNDLKEKQVLLKVGVSYVSIKNAIENLETEQPGWDFEGIRKQADELWNKRLSAIQVKGGSYEDKVKFYTALFHTLIHPNIIDDVNGEYPAMMTKEIKNTQGKRHQYTVFSLWDTYRTLHPLLTLAYPDIQSDILKTMADMAKTTGQLPFWELAADESYVMNGDPAPIVVLDSYVKGLTNFDTTATLQAMLNISMDKNNNPVRPMQSYYAKYGFLPYDDCGPDDEWGKPRMVSECLEYAYGDWAVSEFARLMGKKDEAEILKKRALNAYKHYYDADTGFFRPKYTNGSWFSPFTPHSWQGSWSNPGFVEGNSWQYSFFVPYDPQGLIDLHGGEKAFTKKLQRCFDEKNFTIDNEPDINYPYLFNYIEGEAHRTQKITRHLIEQEFGDDHNGLPGNDDAGTISAWLVFSMMGIYPDCPGTDYYQITSPVFDEITIQLDTAFYSGEHFNIIVKQKKPDSVVIGNMELNQRKLEKPMLHHSDITKGGTLKFIMK